MKKRVRINYREQAKALVSDVTVEYIADTEDDKKQMEHFNELVLEETQALSNEARKYSFNITRGMR